jgi:hypothetical protein
MAYRRYKDADGLEWDAYDVQPLPGFGPPRERRRAEESVPMPASHAWLVFERDGEKRRFSPVPADWDAAPTETLLSFLALATRVETNAKAERPAPVHAPSRKLHMDGKDWFIYELAATAGEAASLVFETELMVRRIRTYPANWAALDDASLSALSWKR